VTPAEAQREIRGYANAGRVYLVPHARQRMRERGAVVGDVMHALINAVRCASSDSPERWKVTGPDLDGDDLTCVVTIEGRVVVITVF
jgi:hypothetical protein